MPVEPIPCTGPDGTGGPISPDDSPAAAPLDVETAHLQLVDEASGQVLQEVLAEMVYDTASGERVETRYIDMATGAPVEPVAGQVLREPAAGEPQPTGVLPLCDTADGGTTTFLRHYLHSPGAPELVVLDTDLDGNPYQVAGDVAPCPTGPGAQPGDESPGGLTPCTPATVERCRCDDTDGDGIPDTDYVEILQIDCKGELTTLGTYTPDLSGRYEPISPVPCDTAAGAEPARGAQAHRIELAPGASWDADTVPLLQAVTATAHGGTGTITTTGGVSTLYDGESASWALTRDGDAALVGELTITADTGAVTVTYTAGVQL